MNPVSSLFYRAHKLRINIATYFILVVLTQSWDAIKSCLSYNSRWVQVLPPFTGFILDDVIANVLLTRLIYT